MDERVVLVTGSSRGIGAHLVEALLLRNMNVAMNYCRSTDEAERLCARMTALYGKQRIICCKADVGNREEVDRMFAAIYDHFGRCDVLVNNAGVNRDRPFIEMTGDEWNTVISTILTGTFNCSQEFARRYKGTVGHIVNIGAVTAITGRKNGVNYCTARAGILNLTRCLALELAPAIAVNTVTPGYITTEEVMTRRALHVKENYDRAVSTIPAGRLGTAEDIFNMIYFLITNGTYLTGQNFVVDGGYVMR